jgi:hypothetical protein
MGVGVLNLAWILTFDGVTLHCYVTGGQKIASELRFAAACHTIRSQIRVTLMLWVPF